MHASAIPIPVRCQLLQPSCSPPVLHCASLLIVSRGVACVRPSGRMQERRTSMGQSSSVPHATFMRDACETSMQPCRMSRE
eukprot:361767-Chlamydomonas_euryale.AAC.12